MTFSSDRLKEFCTTATFDRGVDYYEDGRVSRLDRYGETISATVQGSQTTPYTIEIELATETDELPASCTCPYDESGYCKHVVATWLAVAEREPDDAQPAVEGRLERADPDELREFLRTEFADEPNLRRRFLATVNDQSSEQTLADYKRELASRYPVEDRQPPITGPSHQFSEFERRAERPETGTAPRSSTNLPCNG